MRNKSSEFQQRADGIVRHNVQTMAAAAAASHLDDATSVLCNGEVHVGAWTRPPYWPHVQKVPLGALDQLLVLDAHPSQHHPLRAVIVLQVAVEHRLVYLVHVFCWAKARQSDCVAPVRSLGAMTWREKWFFILGFILVIGLELWSTIVAIPILI